MDLGQPERRTHNYIRHGTLDLFAALNVATGEVLTRCKPQHRAQDFVAFLRDIDASVGPDLEVHVVLDNLSAHKWNTTALVGGFIYKPTTSRILSTSCGSGEILKEWVMCGWRPNVRQMRPTIV